MAIKPADMETCTPKRKCLTGPNEGLAYTPGDECQDGYIFNASTCDCDLDTCEVCDNLMNSIFRVQFTVQNHDTQPCGGISADPCDAGGACPTTTGNGTSDLTLSGSKKFRIDSFQEYQNYADSNSFCPANERPAGQTYADVFGVNKILYGGSESDASTTQSASLSNSLWAIATDEDGNTWAMNVHTGAGGSIISTYRAGGYSNITKTPIGDSADLPTCPDGQQFDCDACACVDAWTSMDYKIQGVQTSIKYCCDAAPTEGCTSCDGSIVPGYPQDQPGIVQEESIVITRAEWDARYSLGVNTNSPCNTYEEFATLASAKTWRGPGLRWTSNDGLTSGCGLSDPADLFACVGRCDGNLSATYVDGQEVIVYSYS